ncbi:Uncharacterised protein [Vibrio cholerae]|nr:Uncharacterised protein [Vibrio cholerae]
MAPKKPALRTQGKSPMATLPLGLRRAFRKKR